MNGHILLRKIGAVLSVQTLTFLNEIKVIVLTYIRIHD